MKDTVSHYVPPHSPITSTEPQVFSNNLTMPSHLVRRYDLERPDSVDSLGSLVGKGGAAVGGPGQGIPCR